jgi:hypothetical protein
VKAQRWRACVRADQADAGSADEPAMRASALFHNGSVGKFTITDLSRRYIERNVPGAKNDSRVLRITPEAGFTTHPSKVHTASIKGFTLAGNGASEQAAGQFREQRSFADRRESPGGFHESDRPGE